jgi:hypothetical protein
MSVTENHTYSRGTAIFQAAAESFGVQLNEGQAEEWRSLIKAAFVLDGILDSDLPQSEREFSFDRAIPELIYPLAENWDQQKLDRIVDAAMHVKDIASEKRAATSARKLGDLAIYEGIETKRFLQLEDAEEISIANFNGWLEVLLPFGVVVDTSIDLPEDYTNGLTQVNPSIINRALIASRGFKYVNRLASTTPAKLYRPLIVAAKAVTMDTNKDMVSNTQDETETM